MPQLYISWDGSAGIFAHTRAHSTGLVPFAVGGETREIRRFPRGLTTLMLQFHRVPIS